MFIYLVRVSEKIIEVLPMQLSTTGFYNRGGKCSLRGTTWWAFKLNGLRFVLKWLICPFLFIYFFLFVLQLAPISFFSYRHLLQFRLSFPHFSFVLSLRTFPNHGLFSRRSDEVANCTTVALRPDSMQRDLTFSWKR
jgi:hypothetical protein